jgi:hypothetical protein
MMGEVEGVVIEASTFDLHGVRYVDVTVGYPDGRTEQARLGPEGSPGDLIAGERVLVTRVVNQIVSIRRP